MDLGLVIIAAFAFLVILVITRFERGGNEEKLTGRGGDFDAT
jgi:hypothetical protein